MFNSNAIATLRDNASRSPEVWQSFEAEAVKDLGRVNEMRSIIPPEFLVMADITRHDFDPLDDIATAIRNMLTALDFKKGAVGTLWDSSRVATAGRAWSDIAQGTYETYRIAKGGSSVSWAELHGVGKNAWEAAVRQAADGSAPSSWSGWQSNTRYHKDIQDAEPGAVFDTANGRIVQMHAHCKEPQLYMIGETIDAGKDVEIVKYLRNGIPCATHGHEWRIVGRRLDLEF